MEIPLDSAYKKNRVTMQFDLERDFGNCNFDLLEKLPFWDSEPTPSIPEVNNLRMDLDANHKTLNDPVIYDDKLKQDLP